MFTPVYPRKEHPLRDRKGFKVAEPAAEDERIKEECSHLCGEWTSQLQKFSSYLDQIGERGKEGSTMPPPRPDDECLNSLKRVKSDDVAMQMTPNASLQDSADISPSVMPASHLTMAGQAPGEDECLSSSDDEPLTSRMTKRQTRLFHSQAAETLTPRQREETDSEDDEALLQRRRRQAPAASLEISKGILPSAQLPPAPAAAPAAPQQQEETDSEDDEPISNRLTTSKRRRQTDSEEHASISKRLATKRHRVRCHRRQALAASADQAQVSASATAAAPSSISAASTLAATKAVAATAAATDPALPAAASTTVDTAPATSISAAAAPAATGRYIVGSINVVSITEHGSKTCYHRPDGDPRRKLHLHSRNRMRSLSPAPPQPCIVAKEPSIHVERLKLRLASTLSAIKAMLSSTTSAGQRRQLQDCACNLRDVTDLNKYAKDLECRLDQADEYLVYTVSNLHVDRTLDDIDSALRSSTRTDGERRLLDDYSNNLLDVQQYVQQSCQRTSLAEHAKELWRLAERAGEYLLKLERANRVDWCVERTIDDIARALRLNTTSNGVHRQLEDYQCNLRYVQKSRQRTSLTAYAKELERLVERADTLLKELVRAQQMAAPRQARPEARSSVAGRELCYRQTISGEGRNRRQQNARR